MMGCSCLVLVLICLFSWHIKSVYDFPSVLKSGHYKIGGEVMWHLLLICLPNQGPGGRALALKKSCRGSEDLQGRNTEPYHWVKQCRVKMHSVLNLLIFL